VGVGCWCGTRFAWGGLAVVQVVVGEVVAGGGYAGVGGCCHGHCCGDLVVILGGGRGGPAMVAAILQSQYDRDDRV
jgi:hypothetical protein